VAAPVPGKNSFRFGLRWLFALTTAAALCAFVFRIAGRDEAIGIAIACLLAAIGWQFRTRGIVKWPAFALAAVAVWFSTVDYRWTVDRCQHCPSSWSVFEVRVLHQPVWSWKSPDDSPIIAMICEDLGSPCEHDVDRWEKYRFWGLIWPRVFHNGIVGLSGGDNWYVPDVRRRVQEIGRNEPQLGEELLEGLRSDNRPVVKKIVARIYAETAP
jgi:hypothetical protein